MKQMTRRHFSGSMAATLVGAAIGPVVGSPKKRASPLDDDPDVIASLSLVEAARRIRSGELTAVRATSACLKRIDVYNPKLDAFISVLREQSLRQAREMDSELSSGKVRGPLHGVPIALKDNIDTAGIRTTAGSKVYDDRVPGEDAEVTRRLERAGAIIIGKANLDEFATGVSYFGSVRNPWALAWDPSGSSSGSAAAVAASLAFGALGTDTGGSIRAPAAYCGVVGLKPTYGLVSMRGIVPLIPTLDHCGPITRSVDDAALLLNELAGYDRLDIASTNHPKEDYVALLDQPVSILRLGIPRAPFFDHLDADTEHCVEAAIKVLGKITKNVRDATLPATGGFIPTLIAEMYAYHKELMADQQDRYMLATRLLLQGVQERLEAKESGCDDKVVSYIRRRWQLELLRREVDAAFTDFDLVVLPTLRVGPMKLSYVLNHFEHPKPHNPDQLNWDNCEAFNVLGLPAISIPCGFNRNGLPVGLMIAGPSFSEGRILALARAFERFGGWEDRRPDLKPSTPVPGIRATDRD